MSRADDLARAVPSRSYDTSKKECIIFTQAYNYTQIAAKGVTSGAPQSPTNLAFCLARFYPGRFVWPASGGTEALRRSTAKVNTIFGSVAVVASENVAWMTSTVANGPGECCSLCSHNAGQCHAW